MSINIYLKGYLFFNKKNSIGNERKLIHTFSEKIEIFWLKISNDKKYVFEKLNQYWTDFIIILNCMFVTLNGLEFIIFFLL